MQSYIKKFIQRYAHKLWDYDITSRIIDITNRADVNMLVEHVLNEAIACSLFIQDQFSDYVQNIVHTIVYYNRHLLEDACPHENYHRFSSRLSDGILIEHLSAISYKHIKNFISEPPQNLTDNTIEKIACGNDGYRDCMRIAFDSIKFTEIFMENVNTKYKDIIQIINEVGEFCSSNLVIYDTDYQQKQRLICYLLRLKSFMSADTMDFLNDDIKDYEEEKKDRDRKQKDSYQKNIDDYRSRELVRSSIALEKNGYRMVGPIDEPSLANCFVQHNLIPSVTRFNYDISNAMLEAQNAVGFIDTSDDFVTIDYYQILCAANDSTTEYHEAANLILHNSKLIYSIPVEFILRIASRIYDVVIDIQSYQNTYQLTIDNRVDKSQRRAMYIYQMSWNSYCNIVCLHEKFTPCGSQETRDVVDV